MTDVPSPGFDDSRTEYLKEWARAVRPTQGDIGAYKALRRAADQRTNDELADEAMWREQFRGDDADTKLAVWLIETDIIDHATKRRLLEHWPPAEDVSMELFLLRIEEKHHYRKLLVRILCDVRNEPTDGLQ